jgi:hypothetical protein
MRILISIATLALSGLVILSTSSCKKEDKCIAGTGGSLTIVAKLRHHGELIPNDSLRPDTVWVKFNAKDWGGAPNEYDLRFIGEFPEDHVHLSGLKCGDYYFYASGWDTSIVQLVKGGIPFSTDKESGEIVLDIPVTED